MTEQLTAEQVKTRWCKKMELKRITMIVCGISMMFTGCIPQKKDADMKEKNIEEESRMEEKYEMTKEQEELLCSISVDERRVKEGKLAKWQIEILKKYDYGMDYLKRKYPSYTFEIRHCEQTSLRSPYLIFGFVEVNDSEGYYEMYVYTEEGKEGNVYEAEDNYYAKLKEDEFTEKLQEVIQEEFGDNIKVDANISCVMGEEYGESLDINKAIQGEIELEQDSYVTISTQEQPEEEYGKVVKKLREFINEREIYGSYIVEFVNEKNIEELLYKEHFFSERGEKE